MNQSTQPKQPPSIFNDVIGPVMTGPSSSHTAAPVRIGKLARGLLDTPLKAATVAFETKGSFAACYHSQRSDKGLIGGLLGWDPEDPRLPEAEAHAAAGGVTVTFVVEDFPADHPNTARIRVESAAGEVIDLVALSIGGGMCRIIELEGFPVAIAGDYYELLVFAGPDEEDTLPAGILRRLAAEGIAAHLGGKAALGPKTLINIKSSQVLPAAVLGEIRTIPGVQRVKCLCPVLPILSHRNGVVPFRTAAEMLAAAGPDEELWRLAARYEAARGGISEDEVLAKMRYVVRKMKAAVEAGLTGQAKCGLLLSPQAYLVEQARLRNALIPAGVINTVIGWSMAVLEINSAMGVVVAAPTAGSCGVLPGAILGTAQELGRDEEAQVRAVLAAGLIGVFIAEQATFSAEVCGCQAECGAASCMAAAGVVQLAGGSTRQAVTAAAIAMQNVLGMVCDSVGTLVEVPCLGKNVMGAVNAVATANLALAGVAEMIPLDECIQAMYQVGNMMPPELCCTGLGGLATTPTAKRLVHDLKLS